MDFRKQLSIILIILTLGLQLDAIAQNPVVKAKLDSTVITIGDQVGLNLSVEQKKSDKVYFPKVNDTLIKSVEVIRILPLDTQAIGNSKIKVTQKIIISAYELSLFKIPPFTFKYLNDTLLTNSLVLSVNPVNLDSTEKAKIDTNQVFRIFDIKSPVNTPWTLKEFLQLYYPYILGFLAIALITTLLIIYFKKRARNEPFIKLPEKPKEPAHIIAFRALDALKAKKLWQSGLIKEYYLELSEIIRAYIEARFNIPTFERTTHELTESIKHRRVLSKPIFEELFQLLSLSDLAKFAKYNPLPNENDLSLKNSYHFVEITMLEEKPNIIIETNRPESELVKIQNKE